MPGPTVKLVVYATELMGLLEGSSRVASGLTVKLVVYVTELMGLLEENKCVASGPRLNLSCK